jgi:predicted methyltransferase
MRSWLANAALATLFLGTPIVAAHATNFAVLLVSAERPEADKVRDADRKPAEVMAFAGVKAGMKISEIAPGGGYYTRLLSAAVGDKGYVYTFGVRASPAIEAWAKGHINTGQVVGKPTDKLAPEPVDMVWTTLNYHDFKNSKVGDGDAAALFNKAAFASLKPGGVYLVNDHEAAAGAGTSVTSTLHRIESAAVIKEVEAAGFMLEARSDLLKHAADDHTQKVFEGGVRGKTDQFILKFRKPKAKR